MQPIQNYYKTVKMMADDSGDEEGNDIVNVTAAHKMCQIPVFDHNLIKIVIIQKLAGEVIAAICLFWTNFSFMTAIFAVILHD